MVMAPVITIRRVRRDGPGETSVILPPGWRAERLAADPGAPPPNPPAPRSVPVPRGRLLVVVNDAQRATPTPWLLERLDCDWASPDVRVAVATGCHAPPAEPELREIFGDFLDTLRPRIHVHRAGADPLVRLGTTSRGTPVAVNSLIDWPAAVVCLGSVEPHYFAGWTGGRKSLVPGLCSLETMRANHRLALEPGAAVGSLADNPLHLDLEEAAGLVRARLIARGAAEPQGVQALVAGGRIHGWYAGPLRRSVGALAPAGQRLFGRRVERRASLVICCVDHPLDRDFYQALKGFEHWKSTVAPGGVLVLVADCPAGVGPPTFTQFLGSPPVLDVLEARAKDHYRLGDHKLLNFLRFTAGGRHLFLVSPGLADRGGLPLPVFASLDEAVRAAGDLPNPSARRALVVEDGATIAPETREIA
jgi:nickel-dependent lactate racemase